MYFDYIFSTSTPSRSSHLTTYWISPHFLKKSKEKQQKTKIKTDKLERKEQRNNIYHICSYTLLHIPKGLYTLQERYLLIHIYCNSIHNSQKLETAEMSIIFYDELGRIMSSNRVTDPSSVFKCLYEMVYVIQPFFNEFSLIGP